MKKSIVFITCQYLSRNNYKRFKINHLLAKNWNVEYWNVQNLFYKKRFIFKHYYTKNNLKLKIYNFKNFLEIVKKILKKKKIFYLDFLNNSFLSNFIRLLFYYKNNKRVLFDLSNYSEHQLSYLNVYQIFKSTSLFFFIKKSSKFLILYLKKNLVDSFFNFKPLFHFTAGLKSRLASENLYGKDLQIISHADDYNKYIDISKRKKIFKDKIVFLDQDFPIPFELDIRQGKKFINAQDYWYSINNFLNFLEKQFKKEAVIAAHPRAMKSRNISNKRIIFDYTNELVKHSFICVAHTSNAVQFCILYQKPLLIIATNDFINNKDVAVFQDMQVLALELNKKIINIDKFKFNDLKKELLVNVKAYNSYINKYIKEKKSHKINSWINLERVLSNYNTKA